MMAKFWFLFLSLVVAIVVVPTALIAPTAQASTACPTALVIGLHGVNEAPTGSKEIAATFAKFNTVAKGKGAQTKYLEYPEIRLSLNNVTALEPNMKEGATELNSMVLTYENGCPGTRISLAGYSEGAWIINYWLQSHSNQWVRISAIELYGDPCWYNPYTSGTYPLAYQGLARIFVGGTCGPSDLYPYPNESPTIVVQSLCLSKDPVCGQGYGDTATEHTIQLNDARTCTNSHCAHLNYTGAATTEGGTFLAQNAFRGNVG